jgi:hypothetical protein
VTTSRNPSDSTSQSGFRSEVDELHRLLSLLLEDRLSDDEGTALGQLLSDHPEFVDVYVDCMQLHGLLQWEAGGLVHESAEPAVPVLAAHEPDESATGWRRKRPSRGAGLTVVAVVVLVLFGGMFIANQQPDAVVVDNGHGEPVVPGSESGQQPDEVVAADGGGREIQPLHLDNFRNGAGDRSEDSSDAVASTVDETRSASGWGLQSDFTDDQVVSLINADLQKHWQDNSVAPSPVAGADEWLRRAYLTFAGRIPTLEESTAFAQQPADDRRELVIDDLLTSRWRSENLSRIWTNLLVGRTSRAGVNRDSLSLFLEEQFQENRPWIDTVGELITAEGRNDQNGAANFLLAHLNNQATPATAVTARLFLGEQLQCVQCHDHPFAKGISQRDYWALNAFFQQTDSVTEVADASQTMPSMQGGDTYRLVKLVDRPRGGMTFFENLRGQEQAVLPEYDGRVLTADSSVNRRASLVEFLKEDSESRVARAMVNRMWAHFFGYGFTSQVDDIGAHVPVSHPELLEGLTEAFVKSDYDLRRLMKWISMSQAWQLSSELIADNESDRPEYGALPLFTRVYSRRMTPEQVYESVRVAIRTASGLPLNSDSEDAEQHRTEWVQQFVRNYNTDENDEAHDFDGTIAQALVMMNGADVNDAITQAAQAILYPPQSVRTSRTSDSSAPRKQTGLDETLNRIAAATLTRQPTASEQKAFRQRIHELSSALPGEKARSTAVEDMMWAYLNSSEFITIH